MKYKRFVPFLYLSLWLVCSLTVFAAKGEEEATDDIKPPTLQAYISGGYLNITGFDESGIAAFFVNGYEYSDITDNTISFRLQRFDASVQYFKIRAIDTAGNLSGVYRLLNPYFDDDPNDNDDKGLSTLPDDAGKSDPQNAQAIVLSHDKTDYYGNLIAGSVDTYGEEVVDGKDFYTIQADSGKVFYLIVDRRNGDEKVYFLTEVSENDLLNLTDGQGKLLTPNSASVDAGGVTIESGFQEVSGRWNESTAEQTKDTSSVRTVRPNYKFLAFLSCVSVAVVIGYFAFKKKKGSKEKEADDEEEEDEEDE